MALCPNIPVLSEESTEVQIAKRRQWQSCWLVDPLDGTREFIDRTDAFTINVALIWQARAVLGFILLPVSHELYIGAVGVGAWRCTPDACTPLRVRHLDVLSPLRVLASVRHSNARVLAVLERLDGVCSGTERINAGSAVKFCRLVDAEADIYPRTSPCYEWDVAAEMTPLSPPPEGLSGARRASRCATTSVTRYWWSISSQGPIALWTGPASSTLL